jgi:hypothetical protein
MQAKSAVNAARILFGALTRALDCHVASLLAIVDVH